MISRLSSKSQITVPRRIRETLGLKAAIAKHGFTGIIAGIREGLEAVRAKERQMEAAVRGGAKAPSWLADVLAGPGVRFVD